MLCHNIGLTHKDVLDLVQCEKCLEDGEKSKDLLLVEAELRIALIYLIYIHSFKLIMININMKSTRRHMRPIKYTYESWLSYDAVMSGDTDTSNPTLVPLLASLKTILAGG